MNPIHIVLIQPPPVFSNVGWKNTVLTHLVELATYAYEVDPDIEILNLSDDQIKTPTDFNNFGEIESFIDELKRIFEKYNIYNKLIFGISAFSSFYYIGSILTAHVLRDLYPKSLICVGGYHANFFPTDFINPQINGQQILTKKIFDYIFLGESDITFTKTIKKLINHNKIESSPENQTEIIDSGAVENLDLLKDPKLDLFDLNNDKSVLSVPIFFSRGCPFRCNFCGDYRKYDSNFFGKKAWRYQSPKRAFKQLIDSSKYYEKKNIEIQFQIMDPLFQYPGWRIKFYELLNSVKFDKELWAEVRVDQFDVNKEPAYMKNLNLTIDFGMESGSEKMLRIMNKSTKPKKFKNKLTEIIKSLEKYQIYSISNYILGHPGETKETLDESLSYIESIHDNFSNTLSLMGKYFITPGSDIFLNQNKYENKYGSKFYYPNYWYLANNSSLLSTYIDPSNSLTSLDVFEESSERVTSILLNSIKKFSVLNDRKIIYKKMFSSVLYEEIPYWKSWRNNASNRYDKIKDTVIIKERTKNFWNSIINVLGSYSEVETFIHR